MFVSSAISALGEGNEISLVGFGNFSVSKVESRPGATLELERPYR